MISKPMTVSSTAFAVMFGIIMSSFIAPIVWIFVLGFISGMSK